MVCTYAYAVSRGLSPHHLPRPAIPCPTQVYGPENLAPLPGSPDPANPTKWVQVGGDPVSFDAVTGARISSPPGSAALFALTEGFYFCMLVESDGEAALFDAPEGTLNKKLQLNYSHLNMMLSDMSTSTQENTMRSLLFIYPGLHG